MSRKLPIFYSALLLTGVNLLLRLAGTTFQVYLSRRIGPAGIGLLQLVMSVGSLSLIAGVAGVRTAAMYLTAGALGRGRPEQVSRILSACFLYSIAFSSTVALLLFRLAPVLASHWIGDSRTVGALRLLAACIPITCLCHVLTGYFTGANRIGTLAGVEVAEQLVSIAVTMTLLHVYAGSDPGRACMCVVLGSSAGAAVCLCSLLILHLRRPMGSAPPFPIRNQLFQTALPLAAADLLRAGIGTTENLMVPKRLALFPREAEPLAAFGMVSGMVFPVMMFPACILYGLAELLIPELARCAAAGSTGRIRYLVRRSLKAAALYGLLFCGLMHLAAVPLCLLLYGSSRAARSLKWYAFAIPVLYCDAITDAMTKGLGQQRICVRYNILTASLDAALLFFLLPRFGMDGYFFSFLLTHVLNFFLSLRRLCRITAIPLPLAPAMLAGSGLLAAVCIAAHGPGFLACALFVPLLLGFLCLFGILRREDLLWAKGLLRRRQLKSRENTSFS